MKLRHLLLVVAMLAAAGCAVPPSGIGDAPGTWHGTLMEPAAQAADFTLIDQHEQSFQLSAQRGRVVLLFFGYTACPDVCPMTLGKFKQVYKGLDTPARDKVRFVLVTVDPEVDTPARLADYLDVFEPSFIGLTGDMATLKQVWGAYGVFVSKHAGHTTGGSVDHTSRMYLIDAQGNWRVLYGEDVTAEGLAQDLQRVLAGR